MSSYILVVLSFASAGYGQFPITSSADFNSEATCQRAAEFIRAEFEKRRSINRDTPVVFCAKK